MHNFPSPWRINYAGEVIRDVKIEENLRKVTPESKPFFTFDADEQKTKPNKESWFRIVRKKPIKKGESNLNFQGIDNILEKMQCFSCGPMGESADDGKKKSRFLPTLTISKNGSKANDGKSKNDKVRKKEQTAASKDVSTDLMHHMKRDRVCSTNLQSTPLSEIVNKRKAEDEMVPEKEASSQVRIEQL